MWEINPLSATTFANSFSHSMDFILILFMVSFAKKKLLSLIRSHFLNFVFIFTCLGGGPKKDLGAIFVIDCSVCFPVEVI